jgi:diacylglycerol kinase family enzyme
MNFLVLLNRDGGTLRTLDLDSFVADVEQYLSAAGHKSKIQVVQGSELTAALDSATRGRHEVVMVGGGDGTVSTAASKLMNSDKALAVLPAGTMNLFARSLGVPMKLNAAVEALAQAEVRAVDLASANGRVFVHQFSVGMHAKLIKLREKRDFASRLGKIKASGQAALDTFLNPPKIKAGLVMKGEELVVSTTGIGITNNLFGEGHLPYPDILDAGVLGIYVTRARRKRELAKFFLNMAIGRWRLNEQVDIYQADELILKLYSRHRRLACAVDGELHDLETETAFRIHPKVLKVLAPRKAEEGDQI